ncbi:glycosyltransferase family 2 protein [Bradyrhizobium cytisi]|uniref:Glycosyltransferase n=1 Tax=Bradyrhizobium cytisi TaxID=515489 RepID=A0A5S4WWI2_9BRAD|nr:glycosyltransferase family 2 protein [Bradyrhizobium cytisi]TYL85918.1 glycosyltransferase [Bradyrhizobium cytisi]
MTVTHENNLDEAQGKRSPLVTVVVPSFNQGRYLEEALRSIAIQKIPTEIIVMDGGSTDVSLAVLKRWSEQLAYWRSGPDGGQASAINEGIQRGTAPYVCWLNSDDKLQSGCLRVLIKALENNPAAPAAYGDALNENARGITTPVWVQPFSERGLRLRCIISQPGTLIRRAAWEALGGLDPTLHFALDYDLWWRLYRSFGPLVHIPQVLAVNRVHADTKTRNNRAAHYAEAMSVVRRHHGSLPLKWWLAQPYAVWWKALLATFGSDK